MDIEMRPAQVAVGEISGQALEPFAVASTSEASPPPGMDLEVLGFARTMFVGGPGWPVLPPRQCITMDPTNLQLRVAADVVDFLFRWPGWPLCRRVRRQGSGFDSPWRGHRSDRLSRGLRPAAVMFGTTAAASASASATLATPSLATATATASVTAATIAAAAAAAALAAARATRAERVGVSLGKRPRLSHSR